MIKESAINLVGISIRTNNKHIFEPNPATNKIAETVQHYIHNELYQKIKFRKNPGRTFCVYTQYDTDETGDYTYFIGEEVSSVEDIDAPFELLTVPAQTYIKFTNQPEPMPEACINMWKSIWSMNESDLGGKRAYIADFEIYDERSHDHNHAVLDIYIGIK